LCLPLTRAITDCDEYTPYYPIVTGNKDIIMNIWGGKNKKGE